MTKLIFHAQTIFHGSFKVVYNSDYILTKLLTKSQETDKDIIAQIIRKSSKSIFLYIN